MDSSGIVDEDVEALARRLYRRYQSGAGGGVGEVPLKRNRVSVHGPRRFSETLPAPRHDPDLHVTTGQRGGDGQSYSLTGPGHERHLAAEASFHGAPYTAGSSASTQQSVG